MDISDAINDLNSRELAVRRRAAEHLATHPDAAAAVSLVRICGDGDEQVREWTVAALEGLGVPEAADAAALAELLSDVHRDVRYWSVTLLGRLGPQAASAVGRLSGATGRDADPAVRQRAAWARAKLALQRQRRGQSWPKPPLAMTLGWRDWHANRWKESSIVDLADFGPCTPDPRNHSPSRNMGKTAKSRKMRLFSAVGNHRNVPDDPLP